jgi:hypothetical protein
MNQDLLQQYFDYNPEVGDLVWKVNKQGRYARVGNIAGTKQHDALYVGVDGLIYPAHRLVWLMVYGKWPDNQVDHINGDPYDNRIDNLRDVNGSINQQNRRKSQCNNNTGFLGVTQYGSRFYTQINKGGKNYQLGHYGSAEEAHAVYLKKKRELHEGCTI